MIGEITMETDNTELRFLVCINLIIVTFVLTIALLNLIIAFMSNAFGQNKEFKNASEQKALNYVILTNEIYFKKDESE